ncbi:MULTISPECIES: hypothetical protein [Aquimarina]|uniref:hypothetical protein n=1 Tax=Aquimarina TaxID=290174 RepID=UPI0004B35130|nr:MULTISPECIES: hypothetical protein [Aquimarina]PKV50529.1 hypothetical protein ATE84_2587 [Aquimarina sp. MAR_2010_214]
MLNNIMNLNGVEKLNRKQQLSVNGGRKQCIDPRTGLCTDYGRHCAELECVLIID